jgi:hypothetical protein
MMELPEDPMMLFSIVNMKLRDFYKDLDDFCMKEDVDKEVICAKLATIGMEYSKEHNKFW